MHKGQRLVHYEAWDVRQRQPENFRISSVVLNPVPIVLSISCTPRAAKRPKNLPPPLQSISKLDMNEGIFRSGIPHITNRLDGEEHGTLYSTVAGN